MHVHEEREKKGRMGVEDGPGTRREVGRKSD